MAAGIPHLWLEDCRQQDTDACLPWPFAVTNGGYPVARIGGRNVIVTRMVCEEAHGPAPFEGADAAHSCNNRRCCNKRHLRWDTRAGNMADAIEAGTTMRGSRSPNAKLVDEDVLAIRRDQIATHEQLAAQYQVSRRLIGLIKRRERWGWLD